ncbi:hypothetical protein CDL15_Pgr020105 [Punica granatum]|uniref:Uncharacterized protein n=1 Tax=Punica granatum TaxID=22663 RepID=A0A218VS09_PUNGR|nr:hypothetical protein CDL15_Pgr020105 [Punica granatum]
MVAHDQTQSCHDRHDCFHIHELRSHVQVSDQGHLATDGTHDQLHCCCSDLFHDHPLGSSDQSRDHRPFEFCGLLLLGHLIEW